MVFSIKPREIIEVSRYNLDSAVSMLQDYIAENPSADDIDEIGKFIYAKLELSKIEAISDAVIEEDEEKLVEEIKDLKEIDERTLRLLKIVFKDLDSFLRTKIENLDRNAMIACNVLNIELKIDPKRVAENLVSRFEENPSSVDLVTFRNLRCVENMDDVLGEITSKLEDLIHEGERYYAAVYSISKALDLNGNRISDVDRYMKLVERIEISDPNSMGEEDYRALLRDFESLDLEKKALKEKLSKVAQELSKRGIDLSNLCDDESLCPRAKIPLKRDEKKRFGIFQYTLIAGTVFSIAVVSIVLGSSKNPKRKIKKLQKKIAKDPLNPDLHIELAQLYEEIGMMEEAMREYRMATKVMEDSG